ALMNLITISSVFQIYEMLLEADWIVFRVWDALTFPISELPSSSVTLTFFIFTPQFIILARHASGVDYTSTLSMLNLILFGPPGSGKGTQSEKLIEKCGVIHLSTGNLLRAEIDNRTDLGMAAKSYMDKGQLVPDEVVLGMIACSLDANVHANGFLFDGFPRTVAQAEGLDAMLSQRGCDIALVLALEVSGEELVHRLVNRGKTSG